MITVREFGEFPRENAVNCGSGEWDKVRVHREDQGETMVEMIEVMNDMEVNSDTDDKDQNLCVLNVNRK